MLKSGSNGELWHSVLAQLTPAVRTQVSKAIGVDDPPEFLEFIERALAAAAARGGRDVLAKLLLERGVLVHILASPDLLELPEALRLMRAALAADARFDMALLRHLTDPSRTWPEDVSTPEMMRVLDLLRGTIGVRSHLVVLMRRFLRVNDAQVRSRAVRLVSASYPAFIESAFGDSDPRVRSNLLEAVCEELKTMPSSVKTLVTRAAADSHHRVATTALYYLAREGDGLARQKLTAMLNHTEPGYRSAAAWALGKLNEASTHESLSAEPEHAPEPAAATGR